ncbi:hypothetical protein [Bacillus arachidis]|uniref:hypothetical protein n=1 Tax=Bacillus arachidis TaxID=2819290 RepID=UPI001FB805FC|nr:hypothetical protein [Bacillus arachidis]
MLNLMRLELMKFNMGSVIKGALIAIFIAAIFLPLIMFDGEMNSYAIAFQFIDTFSRAVFMIFGASLIARFIIQEFQNKTMTVMFMYPINRKKNDDSKNSYHYSVYAMRNDNFGNYSV